MSFALLACEQNRINKQNLSEKCARNLDCLYGLECVDTPPLADGGVPPAGKSCQYKSFSDCDPDLPPATQQCLSGQKCRDGHCTVQCAPRSDCKDDEVCRIGICQRTSSKGRQCYDNRDCPWPETCFYGQCVTRTEVSRCQTDLDCGVGFRCINGRCQ